MGYASFNSNFTAYPVNISGGIIFLGMQLQYRLATVYVLGIIVMILGCAQSPKAPDVSDSQIPWEVQRFEQDLFSLDTLRLEGALDALNKKYPGFTQDFLYNILGTTPEKAVTDLPLFLRSYRNWLAAVQSEKEWKPYFEQVREGCKYVHYYFPTYPLPKKLITFIGPVNSYGNVLTADALAVGLQFYMGKDFAWYGSSEGQQLYPPFLSRRFEPAYMPVNCMKNLVDDIFPNKSQGRPLVEQMVESGKRVCLLEFFLPKLADTLLTGYTLQQLAACRASEKGIWSFFVQNEMLFSTDPSFTRDYLNEGPGTPALGEQAPGNIGQFCGWQIVKKWMEKQKDITPEQLMKTPAATIFQEAKYKP
jgi:hypothetical protein